MREGALKAAQCSTLAARQIGPGRRSVPMSSFQTSHSQPMERSRAVSPASRSFFCRTAAMGEVCRARSGESLRVDDRLHVALHRADATLAHDDLCRKRRCV